MADGFDRFNQDARATDAGGASFVMGLLTGTVLGAGLGMLFAPKAGTELRNQLSEQAATLGNTASETARRAGESASQWAERGREMYNKASDAVAKGADEAQKYVRETAAAYPGSEAPPSTGAGESSSTGSSYRSTEPIRSMNEGPSSTGPRRT
jgi:gas vesicle protein